MSIVIKGEDQLIKLSRDLKAAGEKDLEKELNAGLRKAAEPGKDAIRSAWRRDLPARGGFARKMAGARFTVRVSARNGFRLVASHRYQLKLIDEMGMVRHPLFGDRDHWFTTSFEKRIATRAWERNGPIIRYEAGLAAQRVADKIGR